MILIASGTNGVMVPIIFYSKSIIPFNFTSNAHVISLKNHDSWYRAAKYSLIDQCL